MSFVVSYSPSAAFRRVPPGAWVARCISLVDLGTQHNERFDSTARKLRISWEVFGEDEAGVPLTIEATDGKEVPLTISRNFTVSLNEKANLRKFLASWRGRDFTPEELAGFDISKLLGAYCLLNVTEREGGNGKTYADVASVSPLPSALNKTKPPGVHPLIAFDLDKPDMALFGAFHQALQDTIKASPEWQASQGGDKSKPAAAAGDVPFDDMDSDIPF